MRCILHIGTEKTGTTLLQNWLYENRAALSARKVFLSDALGKPNNRLLPAYFQTRLDDWAKRHRITTPEEKRAYFDGFLKSVRDEFSDAAASHDTVIISSEHLHSRLTDAEEIQALAEFLNDIFDRVDVVCYFRNQYDMAVSAYSTLLKTSLTTTLTEHLAGAVPENYYYNFLSIAENWSSVFGREQCEFRVYDRSAFAGNDLRMDFLDAIRCGVDGQDLDFSIETANVSLTALQSEAYRAVNVSIPYWDELNGGANKLNGRAKRALSRIDALKAGTIGAPSREALEHRFRDSNDQFFARFLGRANAFLNVQGRTQPDPALPMTDAQELVFELLTTSLPLASSSSRLHGRDANYLRDLALRLEAESLEDALSLMQLAQRARPSGAFIARKIEEYKSRLARPGPDSPENGGSGET